MRSSARTEAFPEEGDVLYWTQCAVFRFLVFNAATSTTILNTVMNRVLLIRQTNRDDFILLAGYVKKGEDAENMLVREEVGLNVTAFEHMRNRYFARTNTLMPNFVYVADSEDVSRLNHEISKVVWFPLNKATRKIKDSSLAKTFLLAIVEQLSSKEQRLRPAASMLN